MRRDTKEVRSGQEAGFSAEPTRIDMQSSPRNLDETARQTSAGRRIVGVLASGLGRRSSSHYSPTGSPNSPSLLAKRQFAFPILAVLAVAALGLWLLLPGGALRAQDAAIEYAENGTGPVATYTATDPEGAEIRWGLSGDNDSLFSIEGGVLTFKKAPDFETPKGGSDGNLNTYSVTVQATDSTRQTGKKAVIVEVTNVEEPGTVTLSALRPQSQTPFTATLTDPDSVTADDSTGSITTGITWQWAKADSKNGVYRAIMEKANLSSYKPVDGDVGSYLRATASYTDNEGSEKSAMVVSDYAVETVPGGNRAPMFLNDDDEVMPTDTRDVPENTKAGQAIGDPVAAEDKDGDVLTYTLGGTNAGFFDINRATGQIMTKDVKALDAEGTGGDTGYMVTVRATDPAGVPVAPDAQISEVPEIIAYSADIVVTITVTDVNEAPDVTGAAAATYMEVAGMFVVEVGGNPAESESLEYMADDPETDADSTWTVSGADAGKFDISDEGVLTFKATASPDFEKPGDADTDDVYEVTVVATDSAGNRGDKDVKVTVMNEEEDGVVMLSRTQPRVGVPVTASLTDPDGSISGLRWQWSRGTGGTDECAVGNLNNCLIKDATSDTYTPTAADEAADDNGITLRATATYKDGFDAVNTATMVSVAVEKDSRNKPPAFVDQDTETKGIQNETATREVEENTKADADDDVLTDDEEDVTSDNVGSVVTANDPDPNADPLIYTLSGADAGSFRVRDNGQIEVGAGTKLDYEATKNVYMVTLTAEDSFGESASIMVTIMVTDLDEPPAVTGDATKEYAENGTGMVAKYMAVDPEGAAIRWGLSGDDASDFSIEGGVLSFKKSPNYEKATGGGSAAANISKIYNVTVVATDATRNPKEKKVIVSVTNVEEPGTVTMSALRPQSAIPFTATLTDPDNVTADDSTGSITTGITWQWAKADSKNGVYRAIMEKANLSSYKPVDGDVGSYLRATASYTDNEGSEKSAMVVSDYAVETVPGGNRAPMFLNDDDEVMPTDTRDVPENTKAGQAIGDPVAAEDKDGDVLTYTLGGTNAGFFDINRATGQIMTKDVKALDAEGTGGDTGYMVTVRATDPAGVPVAPDAQISEVPEIIAYSADIVVTITVTDVNEAPDVTGAAAATYMEVAGMFVVEVGGNPAESESLEYMADDPETDADSTWTVSGADAGKFDISDEGVLTFKATASPDFEKPGDADTDDVYEVTVVATDSVGNRGDKDVKVTVMNEEEDGVVMLSRTQPRVGVPVTASLTDPDGRISGLRWQWSRGTGGTDECAVGNLNNCLIKDATSDTYTPTAADAVADNDNGITLRATATYKDGFDAVNTATMVSVAVEKDSRNKPPAFVDQDTETKGIQNETATREVEENTKANADDDVLTDDEEDVTSDNVGSVVTANDPDPNADPLIYTLSGADAGSFRVRDNGQIEVGAGTKLDYEATKNVYMVTLTAEDSFGATATIMVTIMVADLDEAPKISEGGLAITGMISVDYAENETGMVAMYSATGPESADAMWSLEGDDAGQFSITNGGMLTFKSAPDYENAADDGMDNTYMVTVMADDGTYMAMRDVAVTVTNVEDTTTVIGGTLLERYDTDVSGRIDKDELANGVFDYNIEGTLDKADLVELIFSYEIG